MKPTFKAIGMSVALAGGLSLNPAAYGQEAMPAAQQNAIVQKYCVVCHTDALRTGGLSLQHFDAASPDPGEVAMIISKLKGGALGAAGVKPLPDHPTQEALESALRAEAAGAGGWYVKRSEHPVTQAHLVTASIVQELPSTKLAAPDLYRLKLTCNLDTHDAEMQLAWAPDAAPGGPNSAVVDAKPPFAYTVVKGEGAAVLYATNQKTGMPLPAQKLTITNLLHGETVVFPFESLAPTARQTLASCFSNSAE